ncbi:unnamed protein product [Pedinophyceae sp. YPF-701]|nr:unnamed protein product [Pedinophyceae sp. YPF-701]
MGKAEEKIKKGGFGFIFDIDGVLMKGKDPIPGARDAIELVNKAGVPYCAITNNGAELEAGRAARLSRDLQLPWPRERMVMCHTALQDEAQRFGKRLVLVSGRTRAKGGAKEILREHGFQNVASMLEYTKCRPELVPHLDLGPRPPYAAVGKQPVAAIVVLEMPEDWHAELQVMVDLLTSTGTPGSPAPPGEQPVELLFTNFDFTFPSATAPPRLGPGAFYDALAALFRAVRPGQELACTRHGKPHPQPYVYAMKLMEAQLHADLHEDPALHMRRVYAVGDNPASDVRGARAAGAAFVPILVRTGAWHGGEGCDNDERDPADHVCGDVLEAVQLVLALEEGAGPPARKKVKVEGA